MRAFRVAVILPLSLIFCFSTEGFAKVKTKKRIRSRVVKPIEPPIPESPLSPEVVLEETRQTVSNRVIRLADTIDSLFGDKRVDDKKNTSTLRVSQRYFVKSGKTGNEDISATLNLYLPNLQKVEKKIRDKLNPEDLLPSSGDNGGAAKEESPWTLNQETGLVVAVPLNYFAKLRLRRDFLSEKFVHSFYEQVGWSKANEWEEQTYIASDYAINRSLMFRFLNQKDWAMTHHTLKTIHGPSLLQQISDRSAISYDFRFNTLLEGHNLNGNRLSLSTLYRTQLPNGWMYLDLNPELAWEKETHYHPLYNFFLRIELIFGNPRK